MDLFVINYKREREKKLQFLGSGKSEKFTKLPDSKQIHTYTNRINEKFKTIQTSLYRKKTVIGLKNNK